MWFFFAVLVLWGTTAILGRQADWSLPALVLWVWWTGCQYVCGYAALTDSFRTFQSRLMGVLGFTLFVAYFTTQYTIYIEMLPTDTDQPNLWPTVFLSVNLLGPIAMVSLGCMAATVQTRSRG